MKKLRKLLPVALGLAMMFQLSLCQMEIYAKDNISAQYDWSKLEETGKFTLTLTVNQLENDTATLELGDYVVAMLNDYAKQFNYNSYPVLPGDHNNIDIKIVNKTGKTLKYVDDSLKVGAVTMDGAPAKLDVTVFDGQKLSKNYLSNRTFATIPIRNLHKTSGTVSFLSAVNEPAILKDSKFNSRYDYLLDYYSKQSGQNVKELDEFSASVQNSITSNGNLTSGTFTVRKPNDQTVDEYIDYLDKTYPLFHDSAVVINKTDSNFQVYFKETEPKLAKFYFNYFYETCFQMVMFDNFTSSQANSSSDVDQGIADYVYNTKGLYTNTNGKFKETLGTLENDKEADMTMGLAVNGPLTGNAYQRYSFGFETSIVLKAEEEPTTEEPTTEEPTTEEPTTEKPTTEEPTTEEPTTQEPTTKVTTTEMTTTETGSTTEVTSITTTAKTGEIINDTTTPKTGNENHMPLYMILGTISLVGGATVIKRKMR